MYVNRYTSGLQNYETKMKFFKIVQKINNNMCLKSNLSMEKF